MNQIENKGPWALFLGGKWTRKRPSEVGLYPVATREGMPVGHRRLLRRGPKNVLCEDGVATNEPGWQGWWWDRPLPQMPLAESWDRGQEPLENVLVEAVAGAFMKDEPEAAYEDWAERAFARGEE